MLKYGRIRYKIEIDYKRILPAGLDNTLHVLSIWIILLDLFNLQGSLVRFVELTGGIIILWVGAYNLIKGNLTIGQLITFNSFLAYFLDTVKNLINLQPQMQTAKVAANRSGEGKKFNPGTLQGDIWY